MTDASHYSVRSLGFSQGDAHVRLKVIQRCLAEAINSSSQERKVRAHRDAELHGGGESVSCLPREKTSCRRIRSAFGCRVLSNRASVLPEIQKAAWSSVRWATQATSHRHPYADACGSRTMARNITADGRRASSQSNNQWLRLADERSSRPGDGDASGSRCRRWSVP